MGLNSFLLKPFDKGANPIEKAESYGLITSKRLHLLILLYWGLSFIKNFGGEQAIHTIASPK
jgi:hypothetical protein